MSRLRSSLLLIGLLALAPARGNSPFAHGEPSRIWEKKRHLACWVTDLKTVRDHSPLWGKEVTKLKPVTEGRRRSFERLLRVNFPAELTGVEFSGFEDCPAGAALDRYAVLLADEVDVEGGSDTAFGRSSVGDDRIELTEAMSPAVIRRADRKSFVGFSFSDGMSWVDQTAESFLGSIARFYSPEFLRSSSYREKERVFRAELMRVNIQMTIVHELGHLYGLRHEQDRGDAPMGSHAESFCKTDDIDKRNDASITPGGETSTLETEYDLFSIMNYCRDDMTQLAHQAKLICALQANYSPRREVTTAERESFESLLEECAFVRANSFPLGLSVTDKAGLRKLYRNTEPIPAEVDYHDSATKMGWVKVFEKMARPL